VDPDVDADVLGDREAAAEVSRDNPAMPSAKLAACLRR
jgi:hypothetical protein